MDTIAEQSGKLNVPPEFQAAIGMTALRLGRRAQARASLAAMQGDFPGRALDDLARSAVECALLLASGDADAAKREAAPDEGRFYRSYRRAVEAEAFAAGGQFDSAAASATKLSEIFRVRR